MLEIQNNVTEMKGTLSGVIQRLDTTKERICKFQHMSTEASKAKM